MSSDIRVTAILSRPFEWIPRSPGRLLGAPLAIGLPILGLDLLADRAEFLGASEAVASLERLSTLLMQVTGSLTVGVVIATAICLEQGRDVRAKDVWDLGLRRWLPLFFLSWLTSLAVLMGLLMLVVPGLVVATALFVAPAALVDERLEVMDALDRSWGLTVGHRWRLFALGLSLIFVIVVTLLALSAFLMLLDELRVGGVDLVEVVLTWLFGVGLQAGLGMVQAAAFFALLRVGGEAPDGIAGSIDHPAVVFD